MYMDQNDTFVILDLVLSLLSLICLYFSFLLFLNQDYCLIFIFHKVSKPYLRVARASAKSSRSLPAHRLSIALVDLLLLLA